MERDPALRSAASGAHAPDWEAIDTVLLDLDGTLLDLAFDNGFWRERIPQRYAEARGLTLAAAVQELVPRFAACEGRLEWYCIDHWSRELGLDIRALKRADADRVQWLPGAREFLSWVRSQGKRLLLLTNAHPDTLAIKDERTGVVPYFDRAYSSHPLGAPKEDARFWQALRARESFDFGRALFVDDGLSVLRAARAAGIGWLYAMVRPDSTAAARVQDEFPALESVADLRPARA